MAISRTETSLSVHLDRWYSTPLGQKVGDIEQAYIKESLVGMFGYYIVQIGGAHSADLLVSSAIKHRFIVHRDGLAWGHVIAKAEPFALPLASDSVDVLVLPHTLEFEIHPHQILREVERVLIPEGRLLVLNFSTWGLFGLTRLFRRAKGEAPWCGNFLSPRRLLDWLTLLGFEVDRVRSFCFGPPTRTGRFLSLSGPVERLGARWFPFLASDFLLVATKRVSTLTSLRPDWRVRHSPLSPKKAMEPTSCDLPVPKKLDQPFIRDQKERTLE